MSTLPPARGPVSAALVAHLADATVVPPDPAPADFADLWSDDVQLALWLAYEGHYSDLIVDGGAQWDPTVGALGHVLADAFEHELRASYARLAPLHPEPGEDPGGALLAFVEATEARIGEHVLDGRSLSRFVQREATLDQVHELLVERSVFGLKESDPHAFVLPRLRGAAKAALAELLYDEFGSGRADRVHATLYADAMVAAGLDATPGAYLAEVSAGTLAVNNTMSLLCLDVRLAPAAVGHFAAFEATSAVPSRRLAAGIERVGLPEATAAYFHEHVVADSLHEQLAARGLCGALVVDRPDVWGEILFGAFCCLYVDARAAAEQLDRWGVADDAAQVPA